MPWQSPPATENVVLQARFRTLDGRQFGTSAELHVTPDPEAVARRTQNRLAQGVREHSKPPAPKKPADPLPPKPKQLFDLDSDEALNPPSLPAQAPAEDGKGWGWTPMEEGSTAGPLQQMPPQPVDSASKEWQMLPRNPSDRKSTGE
jgi:hypothetical protein